MMVSRRVAVWGVVLLFVTACAPLSGILKSATAQTATPAPRIITATPRPAASASPAPVTSASPLPPTASTSFPAQENFPLHTVFPDPDLPEGGITDLWVDPQGSLWLSGRQGVYRNDGERWLALSSSPADQIFGQDGIGRVWVLLGGGAQIAAFYDGEWTVYGQERGWQPVAWGGYLSRGFGDGLVTDERGYVWLASGGNDLRRLSPENGLWWRFNAEDIGYRPPAEEGYQGHFLTDVLNSAAGKLWVSNCIGVGESLAGQGIRRYDGQSWQSTAFTQNDCIFDMEVDSTGVVWAGAMNALLRYSPISGSWSRIDLPLWGRFQVVVDVTLDEKERPWVELLRAGGASLDGGAAHYYLDGNNWVPVLELSSWQPNSLLVDENGTAWVFLSGSLYHFVDGVLEEIGRLPADYALLARDGHGRIWIARTHGAGGLWWYDPPQPE
jgi:hypothetical protein